MSMSKFATMEDYYKHRAADLEKQIAELLEALVLAERTLCEQEDSLRSMGCHEINAEPAILTARALIAKHGGGA